MSGGELIHKNADRFAAVEEPPREQNGHTGAVSCSCIVHTTCHGAEGSVLISSYLHAIDTKRSAILQSVEALAPADRARRPDADTWSAVEIVEHLALAERTVLGDVQTAEWRGLLR